MAFAVFRCCPTTLFLQQYESSTDAVLRKLDVTFVDLKELNCCGYPMKNVDFKAFVLSSARNLALAEKEKVDLLTFCNCCFGSLKHAQQVLAQNDALSDRINTTLSREGLQYQGTARVKHLLEVLYTDIGLDTIKEKLVHRFQDLKIATHYGCHILRPSQIVQFDNPVAPTRFDALVEITGAKSISWQTKLECCGSPLWGVFDELSMDLTEKKLKDAKQSGADFLCVACAYCQIQFDRVQDVLLSRRNQDYMLPSLIYTQLLGLALGLDAETLGISQNRLDSSAIGSFLS